MTLNRRECLSLLGTSVAAGLATPAFASHPLSAGEMFSFPPGTVYLNAARLHPLPAHSIQAIQAYLEVRRLNPVPDAAYFTTLEARVKKSFAQLINATPEEIAFTPSAQVTENLVLAGLGLNAPTPSKSTGNIVTDTLHYRGSMYLYGDMARRGHDIRIVQARDNCIHLEDLAARIDAQTKLVALSLVSYMNGFHHDLKAVCDLAHAHGALVYADIVQAVGAVPLDVRATGVDFCGATAHKWLMGDHGLGFLYVRAGLLDTHVARTQFGGDQVTGYVDHVFPGDTPVGAPTTWQVLSDAGGHFEVGTKPSLVVVSLAESIDYLNRTGVATLQSNRRPLIDQLMREVPKLGYACETPNSDTGIVSFSVPEDRKAGLTAKLASRNVTVSFIEHTLRVSPSVYNTHDDVESLLNALRS